MSSAQAFSAFPLFANKTNKETIGGGGRYFTGSPLDALTCDVCHVPEGRFDLEVTGFDASITPGKRYELRVQWSGEAKRVAFNAEIVGANGQAAGKLLEPTKPSGAAAAPAQANARQQELLLFADAEPKRQVMGVGANDGRKDSVVEFVWEAPDKGFEGSVWVHVAAIRKSPEDDSTGEPLSAFHGNEVANFRLEIPFGSGARVLPATVPIPLEN